MDTDCFEIYIWVTITICIFGVIGNWTAFYIFGKMGNRNASTYLLRVLAFADSFFLVVYCTNQLGYILYTNNFWQPFASCYLVRPLLGFTHTSAIWTLLLVGIHRYIVVCKPLKAKTLCTIGNTRRHFLGVLLLSFTVTFPLFFEYEITEKTSNDTDHGVIYGMVRTNLGNSAWYHIGYRVVFHAVIMHYGIPVGSLIFITVRLLQSLRSSRQIRMELSEGQRQVATNRKTEWMVIVVLIMFLLCHTGLPVRLVIRGFGTLTGHGDICKSVWFVSFIFNENLILLNSAINIVIYIGFNWNFRQNLCLCIKSVTSRQNNQQPAILTWWP